MLGLEDLVMRISYYAETDSLYLELSSRASVTSREDSPGVVLYDAEDVLVSLDIDHASRKLDLQELRLHRLPLVTDIICA